MEAWILAGAKGAFASVQRGHVRVVRHVVDGDLRAAVIAGNRKASASSRSVFSLNAPASSGEPHAGRAGVSSGVPYLGELRLVRDGNSAFGAAQPERPDLVLSDARPRRTQEDPVLRSDDRIP